MKHIRRALAAITLTLAMAYHSPGQPPWQRQGTPPEPINLDIPEPIILTPEELKERELAVQAARNPNLYHALLLELEPERGPREQLAALAILHPQAFRKAHPPLPEQARAEAVAERAILNPRPPAPPAAKP